MSYSGVEHKLRVFISSKCGGKYTIARKALKKLLEATGLVEAYAFETEPASSEDTQSAYLEYVDGSNLCIFLVDNEDGIPAAVLSEEKRAKGKQLRLLYIFCDERKKEPTPMQDEIKASLSQKYQVVHEFSDLVLTAYDSVMQDIISIYKRKEEPFSVNDSNTRETNSEPVNLETQSLLVTNHFKFPYVCSTLTKRIVSTDNDKETREITSLEQLLGDQLQMVLYLKRFDENVTDEICNEVIKGNSGEICEVLKLRFQAQKNYYFLKYADCIKHLQNAIAIVLKSPSIPTWIANDIAIDIRHVQIRMDEQNNQITLENPGQKIIDEINEPVYFPYLDRQIENLQEEISKKYYSQLSISPYTTQLGGIDNLFSPLANAFCIAQLHGSIVQTEITRDRLISIYSMLCILYDDHDLVVEYIRLLISNRDVKKLDTVIRTYNQSVDILSRQDINSVLNSVNNNLNSANRMMSKYLLASRLGYYMDDASYADLYKELIEYAMGWVCNEKRIYSIDKYIFAFLRQNNQRVKVKDIIEFICEIFQRGLARYYMDCFKVLRRLNYCNMDQKDQEKVKKILIEVADKDKETVLDQYYSATIIQFCKTTILPYEDLEGTIAEKHPQFYRRTFMLELSIQRNQDLSEHIKLYLDEARARNKTQGMNGTYSGYSYESLEVVHNIIKIGKINLDKTIINDIVDAALETLSSEGQTIQAKRSAIALLQLIYYKSPEQEIWGKVEEQMITNQATFSVGNEMDFFAKDTNFILSFQYALFLHSLSNYEKELLLEKLYSTDAMESYTAIQFLQIIALYLEITKDQVQDEILASAFLYYCIYMSQHKEQDIKYHATICLIELTNFANTRQLALIHLSQIMDSGSQTSKLAVMNRLGQIQFNEDDAYLRQIINKGKSDSNYLIRKTATRENFG